MGVDAGLHIFLVEYVAFDRLYEVLTNFGWSPGTEFGYTPAEGEVGDWESAPLDKIDEAFASVREREARRDVVAFSLWMNDDRGNFLMFPESRSIVFSPGIRPRLDDGRTSDVSVYLRAVLLPVRSAFAIDRWTWEESA